LKRKELEELYNIKEHQNKLEKIRKEFNKLKGGDNGIK
jgi:hypothetical protein